MAPFDIDFSLLICMFSKSTQYCNAIQLFVMQYFVIEFTITKNLFIKVYCILNIIVTHWMTMNFYRHIGICVRWLA